MRIRRGELAGDDKEEGMKRRRRLEDIIRKAEECLR
jgi:hypothetical protein